MLAKLPRQCSYCRSILYIEDKKEITQEVMDGRRVLSVVCPVCETKNEIDRRRVVPKEVRMFKSE